jgi:hypothetical protein
MLQAGSWDWKEGILQQAKIRLNLTIAVFLHHSRMEIKQAG